jgi:tetratricopeptide (TPR) repeat protein
MKIRQSDRAVEACRQAIDLDPNHPFPHWVLARTLDVLGDLEEAQKAVGLSAGDLLYRAHLGYALAKAGKKEAARTVIQKLEPLAKTRYVCAYDIGLTCMGLEEKGLAFKWFEQAFEERTLRLRDLNDPAFDNIRLDHRFQALAQRMDL